MDDRSLAYRWLTSVLDSNFPKPTDSEEEYTRKVNLISFCACIFRYLGKGKNLADLSNAQISCQTGMSEKTIIAAKRILQREGYIAILNVGINGKTKTTYEIKLPPSTGAESALEEFQHWKRSSGNTGVATGVLLEQLQPKEDIGGKRRNKEQSPPTKTNLENDKSLFDEWWDLYPRCENESGRSRKSKKPDCRKLFQKIVTGKHPDYKATADELIVGVKLYADESANPLYVKSPYNWLKDGEWEAYGEQVKPWWQQLNKPLTLKHGRAIVNETNANGHWPPEWGPAPGEPGYVWEDLEDDIPEVGRFVK